MPTNKWIDWKMSNYPHAFAQSTRLLAILLALLIPIVSGQAAESTSINHYGGAYRAPLVSEPSTLDPALYTDIYSMSVASNIFDGLVEFDDELNVVPSIARRWKISRDHKTYTFQLRPGVKFHNNREVTAKDFIFSFTRILDPSLQSPVASFFNKIVGGKEFHQGASNSISGLRAPDRYTLEISLTEPFAPFLHILAMVNAKVVPMEATSEDFGRKPVGTGPFRFENWKSGDELVLKANEDYFGGRPYLNTLHFKVYQNIDWEEIFSDFQNGQLEHALIPSDRYDEILSRIDNGAKYTLVSKPGLNIVYVGFNTRVEPFNDVRIRQAFNYAVDRQAIVRDITRRGSTAINGIIPPGLAGFDPEFKGYGYDPAKALNLLKEAGYPNGEGFPRVALWTISKAESVQRELQAYKEYLANIGVRMDIQIAEDWNHFVNAIQDKEAAMFYAAWYADYPDPDNFFHPLLYSKSRTNRMAFSDSRIDKMLDRARTEMDYVARSELYREIENIAVREAPLISQHVNGSNYLFRSRVEGIQLSHLGSTYLPFKRMWLNESENFVLERIDFQDDSARLAVH